MKPTLTRAMAVLCSALLAAQPYIFAQQPSPSGAPAQAVGLLSPQQLDSLVAPIALFPDPILSQLLVGSTYPMEIVEAHRWVSQNPGLKGQQLTAAAAQQPWDASVQALVAFPDLLQRLNQNISWTTDLGNAFIAQQADVMQAIQRMRQRAQANGMLQSTAQQAVSTSTYNAQNYIVIEPTNPQVVYLPVYDPAAIWGPAPIYYPYPSFYYGAGPILGYGPISFGLGIAVGALWAGGWGWSPFWGGRTVIINNNFIRRNNFNPVRVTSGNNWVHNPAHRGAAPYRNPAVANRFNPGRPAAGGRPGMGPGAAGALRPGQPGARGAGMRPTPGQVQQQLQHGGRPGMGPGRRTRETGRSFLVKGANEVPGYGLYSYLLLGSRATDDSTRDRYVKAIQSYLDTVEQVEKLLQHLPQDRLNVTYLPIEVAANSAPTADWLIDHYDYARARSFLDMLPGNLREGPYFISALKPLSSGGPVDHYLFQDLSGVPSYIVSLWVREFLDQTAQEHYWTPPTAELFVLTMRKTIGVLAEGLPEVGKSLGARIAWLHFEGKS